jgi:hypothetical protein
MAQISTRSNLNWSKDLTIVTNIIFHYAKIPLLQRIIYSGFPLKTAVNGFTAVVKRKLLLSSHLHF